MAAAAAPQPSPSPSSSSSSPPSSSSSPAVDHPVWRCWAEPADGVAGEQPSAVPAPARRGWGRRQRVLILGGRGLLGPHVARALLTPRHHSEGQKQKQGEGEGEGSRDHLAGMDISDAEDGDHGYELTLADFTGSAPGMRDPEQVARGDHLVVSSPSPGGGGGGGGGGPAGTAVGPPRPDCFTDLGHVARLELDIADGEAVRAATAGADVVINCERGVSILCAVHFEWIDVPAVHAWPAHDR
jgi:hypothetical protein